MKTNIKMILAALLLTIAFIYLPFPVSADQGEGKGHYMKHQYSYKEKDGKVAARFKPFLPRSDTIVIGAMLELINKVYGKHQVEDLKPKLIPRNGRNLICFRGIGYDYFFILFKQDTGEVHSISM
jgi:hypothetical protein